MNWLPIISFVVGILIGLKSGWTLGKDRGWREEFGHVTAWLLGAHRVEERLDPKETVERLKAGEHRVYRWK
jgi:hypothetical protein